MNIAFVGLSGVPYLKRASDTRLLAFAIALVRSHNSVTIFNRMPVFKENADYRTLQIDNRIKILEVINRSKSSNHLVNLIVKVISYPLEFTRLIYGNRHNKIDILHVYSGHFFEYIHYYLIAKWIGAKTVYQYVEFRSSIERRGFYHTINGYLCDKFGAKLFDGVICISNYLANHVEKISSKTPVIKVPPICDFSFFDSVEATHVDHKYLLYCGSVDYMEVIEIIINAFKQSEYKKNRVQLVLIVSGAIQNRAYLQKIISKNVDILIKFNLEYTDLIKHYKAAEALLIPLRNTTQDIARFPNKICEYTASRNVVITNRVGEIPFFFEDKKNALIANSYSTDDLTEKINWLFSNENIAKSIRQRAYEIGRQNFDIENYVIKLDSFLKSLLNIDSLNKERNNS